MVTKVDGNSGVDRVQPNTVDFEDLKQSANGVINLSTKQNLAATTFADFAIPAGVKRVTMMLDGTSTNGTSPLSVKLNGEVTGYDGAIKVGTDTLVTTGINLTSANAAAGVYQAKVKLDLFDGDTWSFDGICARTDTAAIFSTQGSKTLVAPLSTVRLTTVNGTDTFDAGSVNVSWEF